MAEQTIKELEARLAKLEAEKERKVEHNKELRGSREIKDWSGDGDGEMEIEDFIERVDLLRQDNEWSDEDTVRLVRRKLIGAAARYARNETQYFQTPYSWVLTSNKLYSHFGKKHDRVEEMMRLINTKIQLGESYRQYADRCKTTSTHIMREYEKAEERAVARGIRDDLVLGVFLAGIDRETSRMLRGRTDLKTLDDILDTLDEMGPAQSENRDSKMGQEVRWVGGNQLREEKKGPRGGNTWQSGAQAQRGESTTLCQGCTSAGRLSVDCMKGERSVNGEGGVRSNMKRGGCFKCGAFGHGYNWCPQARCECCGKTGHIARNCKNKWPPTEHLAKFNERQTQRGPRDLTKRDEYNGPSNSLN